MAFQYFDAHSHLHGKEFDADRELVLLRMKEKCVGTITVGTDLEESKRAVTLAERSDLVWAAVGQHPVDRKEELFETKEYKKLLGSPRVVAVGECGLDYYRTAPENRAAESKRQHNLFKRQVELALEVDKPLMLHCRPTKNTMDAYEEVLQILEEYKHESKLRGNVHFFVGNMDVAKRFQSLNFTFSFTGVVTFTEDYTEVLRALPLEAILSETDAPYVAPVPFRRQRNEPTYVVEVVEQILRIRGEDAEASRKTLLANTKRVFGSFLDF